MAAVDTADYRAGKKMITVSAPAKVNLVFQVAPLAADGYHPVNSLYLELDLRDKLTLVPTGENEPVKLSVHSNNLPLRHVNSVPIDQNNLVFKVAEKLFNLAGVELAGFDIRITKEIPVAGGMAGGSADAAAMLVAGNHHLHEIHGKDLLDQSELVALAKGFGSDVPFSLIGGLAVGTNHGEILQSLSPLAFDSYFVIAISQEGLSTPQVFSRFDEIGESSEFIDLTRPIADINSLAKLMQNDLEATAITLLPSIRNTIDVLGLAGAKKAMVTGSGPTVIGLFDSAELATNAAQMITDLGLIAIQAVPSYRGTRLES